MNQLFNESGNPTSETFKVFDESLCKEIRTFLDAVMVTYNPSIVELRALESSVRGIVSNLFSERILKIQVAASKQRRINNFRDQISDLQEQISLQKQMGGVYCLPEDPTVCRLQEQIKFIEKLISKV